MTITTSNPERARRISDLWTRNPTMTEAEVTEQVDAQLAAEAEERAEGEARTKELTDSMKRMAFTCPVCEGSRLPSAADGLCNTCRGVVYIIRAEQAGGDTFGDGRTRRELCEAYVDRKDR